MSDSLETLHLGPDLGRIEEEASLHGRIDVTVRAKDSRNKVGAGGAKPNSKDLSEGRERKIALKTYSERPVSSLHLSFFLPYVCVCVFVPVTVCISSICVCVCICTCMYPYLCVYVCLLSHMLLSHRRLILAFNNESGSNCVTDSIIPPDVLRPTYVSNAPGRDRLNYCVQLPVR